LKRQTAGELSKKAAADTTKYDALEVGHALTDDVMGEIRKCIELHNPLTSENEYCIVRVITSDPLIRNAKRHKYYAWLYLPSPRPNQAVFLYNRSKDTIKRLWVLPCAEVMAELAGTSVIVDKRYQTMQAWSVAFFKGTFWEYIRHEHGINMPSEHEYFLAHRDELIKAGCKVPDATFSDPFDFSKIAIKQVIDAGDAIANENALSSLGKA
jgi:hypothetical protein